MTKLQFFYDYECPFCMRGYEYLTEHIKSRPDIEVEWRPIELHPRPEDHSPHTNLACQCYYIARELEADIQKFHTAMFQAVAIERRNVEDPQVLCGILEGIADTARLRALLDSGKYAKQIDENNDLAYEKNGVWYLPALRMNGKKLDAKGGAGITADELKIFLG